MMKELKHAGQGGFSSTINYATLISKGGDPMKQYIVEVRDFSFQNPTDERLKALDLIFVSPVVEMRYKENPEKAMDEFDTKFGKHFQQFLIKHYTWIPL